MASQRSLPQRICPPGEAQGKGLASWTINSHSQKPTVKTRFGRSRASLLIARKIVFLGPSHEAGACLPSLLGKEPCIESEGRDGRRGLGRDLQSLTPQRPCARFMDADPKQGRVHRLGQNQG